MGGTFLITVCNEGSAEGFPGCFFIGSVSGGKEPADAGDRKDASQNGNMHRIINKN